MIPMDYSNFESTDLLTDDAFLRWVQKPDEASDRFWAEFQVRFPHKTETVKKARQMALELEQAQQEVAPQDETALERMWGYIEKNTVAIPTRRIGQWPSVSWYAAAASVIMLLGAFWWFGQGPRQADDLPTVMQITTTDPKVAAAFTTVQGPLAVKLADGSRIQLSAHSSLRFPKVFDADQREVYLVGEGFFDVAKRAEQPFLVHTNELVTRVVGTSFRIKAYDKSRDISVDVKTGKVAVSVRNFRDNSPNPKKSVTLTPNQKVVYETTREQLHKGITDNPILLNKDVALQFDDAPIGEVFRAVEKEYGIPILYDKTSLAKCTLTTSIDDLSLFDQMKLICAAVNATYEQQEGRIVVRGGSCQ